MAKRTYDRRRRTSFSGFQWPDRVRLWDGRTGTICCAVTRTDQSAWVIPDQGGFAEFVDLMRLAPFPIEKDDADERS